ncbi:MAG: branched-chain amino acid transporter permease [Acetivibrionales bacterium]|jgi:branched-subunit amino acid transport protein AzlD
MRGTLYVLLCIAVASICTIAVRFAPFLIFGNKKEIPEKVVYLGKYLPAAIIATLVIYCLKDIDFTRISGSVPGLISVAVVAALHLWKRNTLLSIGCGTLCYMALVRIFTGISF